MFIIFESYQLFLASNFVIVIWL